MSLPVLKNAPMPKDGDKIRAAVYTQVRLAQPEERSPSGKPFDVKIQASTDKVARDGGVILMSAWSKDLSYYRKNPVVQWAHDYQLPPIAVAVDTKADKQEGMLIQWWRFLTGITTDMWDQFSGRIKALYAVGGMNAASVGWLTHDARPATQDEREEAIRKGEREPFWVVTRGELLEVSAVPVPSDPDAIAVDRALASAKQKGVDVKQLADAWSWVKGKGTTPEALRSAAAERMGALAHQIVQVPVAWLGGIAFERDETPVPAAIPATEPPAPVDSPAAPEAETPPASPAQAAENSPATESAPGDSPAAAPVVPDSPAAPEVKSEPALEAPPAASPAAVEEQPAASESDDLLRELEALLQTTGESDEIEEAEIDRLLDSMASDTRAQATPSTPTRQPELTVETPEGRAALNQVLDDYLKET